MTLDQIKELAGHRDVSPWIIKLVQEAVELTRQMTKQECMMICLDHQTRAEEAYEETDGDFEAGEVNATHACYEKIRRLP